MQTGGYDVVVEVNESLLNMFLKLTHCMGKFPVFKGTYTLPLQNVPPDLQEFIDIGYEVSLAKAPSIDFTSDLHILMTVRGQVKFTVLGNIDFELEAQFTIGLSPTFNQVTRRLHVDFVSASIDDVELNDTLHLPANVIAKLNEIIGIAMHDYLTDDITTIELSPVIFSTELPYMPPGEANKLTVGLGNMKVLNSKVMAAAVNLLGYTGGNVNAITDFTDNNHIGIGVNEGAMHRVYDFWWQKTTHNKTIPVTGSKDFDLPSIVDWLDDIADWAVAIATLGLLSVDVDIERVWAEYGATIHFSKFSFDLKPGNIVEVSGSITIDLWLKVYVQVKETTEAFWGLVEVSENTYIITLFDLTANGIVINIDTAAGKVALDSFNRLTVDLTDLHLSIPLDWEIPEFILDWVVEWACEQIVDNLPPIVLFPAMIEQNIPGSTVTVKATVNKLTIDEPEALVAANIETSGAETYAPYVANKNPDSMEVHKRDCEWAHRIATRHRAYYCDLEKALAEGFDGCYYCLLEHHTG